MSEDLYPLTDRGALVVLIMHRYKIDGQMIDLDMAMDLLARLDTEADYLGAYIDD